MRKILLLLCSVLLVSCMTDYYCGQSNIKYRNDSSHDIYFVGTIDYHHNSEMVVHYCLPKRSANSSALVLNNSGTLGTRKASKKVYFLPEFVWMENKITTLRFDNEVEISIYESKCVEKSAHNKIEAADLFSYTFTDADYEFALENGTLLEQE